MIHALQNTQNECHQWLSDSSKVHQIHFRSGPRHRWGPYIAPQIHVAGLRGPTSKGSGGEGKWKGCGSKKSRNIPSSNFCSRPCPSCIFGRGGGKNIQVQGEGKWKGRGGDIQRSLVQFKLIFWMHSCSCVDRGLEMLKISKDEMRPSLAFYLTNESHICVIVICCVIFWASGDSHFPCSLHGQFSCFVSIFLI